METNLILALTETFEGHAVSDHFVDVNKMIELGSGSQREIAEFLRIWESVFNPDFNYGEFAIIRSQAGLIERTIPQKATSRLQKYRLTEKGRKILLELKSE